MVCVVIGSSPLGQENTISRSSIHSLSPLVHRGQTRHCLCAGGFAWIRKHPARSKRRAGCGWRGCQNCQVSLRAGPILFLLADELFRHPQLVSPRTFVLESVWIHSSTDRYATTYRPGSSLSVTLISLVVRPL